MAFITMLQVHTANTSIYVFPKEDSAKPHSQKPTEYLQNLIMIFCPYDILSEVQTFSCQHMEQYIFKRDNEITIQ
jgi:hypothetical protein